MVPQQQLTQRNESRSQNFLQVEMHFEIREIQDPNARRMCLPAVEKMRDDSTGGPCMKREAWKYKFSNSFKKWLIVGEDWSVVCCDLFCLYSLFVEIDLQ